ncbi:MAG: methyltransferase domain-containing protein [Alphaproteobacteria bacterium]
MVHDFNLHHEFYRQPWGMLARDLILAKIQENWQKTGWKFTKETEFGAIGYVLPYLQIPALNNAARTIIMLLEDQPKQHFTPSKIKDNPPKNSALMVKDDILPFDNNAFDRLLLIHSLEYVNHRRKFLQEVWRILKKDGKITLIVPSRRGFWARNDKTPFGDGQPFNRQQLRRLLALEKFEITHIDRALYMPPVQNSALLRLAPAIERAGSLITPQFGGVLIVEAEKRLYAPLFAKESVFSSKFIPKAMPQPAMFSKHK